MCLQVGHRRVQHPGHTNGDDDKLGGLTQACFELLLLLQLEAVAMMAPLTSLDLLLSLSVPCDGRITGLYRAAKKKQEEAVLPCCCCDIWSHAALFWWHVLLLLLRRRRLMLLLLLENQTPVYQAPGKNKREDSIRGGRSVTAV